MAFQYSEKVHAAQREAAHKAIRAAYHVHLEMIAKTLGTSAVMKLFTGPLPADCAAPNPPGEVVEYDLPPQPFLAPRDEGQEVVMYNSQAWIGDVSKDVKASDIKEFRLYDYLGECHIQGSVSPEGDGGDLLLHTGPEMIRQGQRLNIGEFIMATVLEAK
jgi:hypothetical protein